MNAVNDVLFEEISGTNGDIGLITLNRPSVLNSLNHAMVVAMRAQLQQWAEQKRIKAIVIRAAEGRAFCAGGDLRLTYDRCKTQDPALTDFFRSEYQLNRLIFHYPKPYIALLDGITMGGGVGISIHGSHRVATDQLLFAMPETGIGFFPDVGGTYFLPRLPGKLGYYLGLTGARIGCDDCVEIGIAQHKVERDMLPMIITALAKEKFGADAYQSVTQILEQWNKKSNGTLLKAKDVLDDCFMANTMEKILVALEKSAHPLCEKAKEALMKKSPTSLKITLEALQRGAQLDFDAVMQQEFRLTSHFLQGHDFPEGIRAVIIDKDNTPRWRPERLQDVTSNAVEAYFSPLEKELV